MTEDEALETYRNISAQAMKSLSKKHIKLTNSYHGVKTLTTPTYFIWPSSSSHTNKISNVNDNSLNQKGNANLNLYPLSEYDEMFKPFSNEDLMLENYKLSDNLKIIESPYSLYDKFTSKLWKSEHGSSFIVEEKLQLEDAKEALLEKIKKENTEIEINPPFFAWGLNELLAQKQKQIDNKENEVILGNEKIETIVDKTRIINLKKNSMNDTDNNNILDVKNSEDKDRNLIISEPKDIIRVI